MAYTITKSDGATTITVEDGSANSNPALSIDLVGKNTAGYGGFIATSFVHLLENFNNSSAPSNPIVGQTWWDNSATRLKVYNGVGWTSLAEDLGAGDLILTGDLLPAADCNGSDYNIGSATLKFCNVWAVTFHGDLDGTANSAKYADLAERFHADETYEPGTVLKLGGTREVTATTEEYDMEVLGVVSEKPGFLLNSKAGEDTTHPKIAFAGRVDVLTTGTVKKGDRLVASKVPGKARALSDDELKNVSSFSVIGRALEDGNGGKVLAVVGAK
jgi:hypothetical protein